MAHKGWRVVKPQHNQSSWMPDKRLPKKILYRGQVGKRSHGGRNKRYKDTLKVSFKDFNIPTHLWEQIA